MKKTTKQIIMSRIVIPMIFLIGLGILLYPTISNYILVRSQTMVVEHYDSKVNELTEENKDELKKGTEAYNKSRVESTPSMADTFSTEKVQETKGNAVDDSGNQIFDVMQALLGESLGTIEIPKIHLTSPIYRGTTEDILQKGIGWLEGSSLPSGGESTHTVLTGHRGLPTAELFTNLPELVVGDQFVITYLDDKLAYEVDQILTVLPEETDALRIEAEQDYATLITCTPYMVNSHRLYVRGHRIPYSEEKQTEQKRKQKQQKNTHSIIIIGIAIVVILLLLIFILRRRKKRIK